MINFVYTDTLVDGEATIDFDLLAIAHKYDDILGPLLVSNQPRTLQGGASRETRVSASPGTFAAPAVGDGAFATLGARGGEVGWGSDGRERLVQTDQLQAVHLEEGAGVASHGGCVVVMIWGAWGACRQRV